MYNTIVKERRTGQGSPDYNEPTSQINARQKGQRRPADPKEALKILKEYFAVTSLADVRRFSGSGKCMLDYIREEESQKTWKAPVVSLEEYMNQRIAEHDGIKEYAVTSNFVRQRREKGRVTSRKVARVTIKRPLKQPRGFAHSLRGNTLVDQSFCGEKMVTPSRFTLMRKKDTAHLGRSSPHSMIEAWRYELNDAVTRCDEMLFTTSSSEERLFKIDQTLTNKPRAYLKLGA